MAVMCTFLHGASPFKEIVLHPLIRDAQGRKMSKSLGNVIDPMSLIEGQSLEALKETLHQGNLSREELARATKELTATYPEGIRTYGADALRFALVQSTIQSEALKFDIRGVEAARYLCTKLWNAVNFYKFNNAKLATMIREPKQSIQCPEHDLLSSWIVLELRETQSLWHSGFSQRTLANSTACVRYFLVDQLCDVYLEFVKTSLRLAKSMAEAESHLDLLKSVLERVLQMLGPFMPHITEELWHALGHPCSIHDQGQLEPLPEPKRSLEDVRDKMGHMSELLKGLRALSQRQTLDVTIFVSGGRRLQADLSSYLPHLTHLTSVKSLKLSEQEADCSATRVTPDIAYAYTTTTDWQSVSVEPSGARKKMQKKMEQLREVMSKAEYASRVPAAIQEKHKQELQDLEARLG